MVGNFFLYTSLLGLLAQLFANPTADPGVASLILARSHTFVEIDHEIISSHSTDSRRVVISYKAKVYVGSTSQACPGTSVVS